MCLGVARGSGQWLVMLGHNLFPAYLNGCRCIGAYLYVDLEEHTRRLYAAAVAQEAEDKYLATLPHASHSKNRKSYGTVISVQSSRVMQDKLAFAPDPQRSAAQSRRLQPAAAKS